MPLLIPALVGMLVNAMATMVGRIIVGIGFGLVTFGGVSILLSQAKDMAFGYISSAAAVAQVGNYFGVLQVGTCMNILFSAFAVRLLLKGLSGDTIKRWVSR